MSQANQPVKTFRSMLEDAYGAVPAITAEELQRRMAEEPDLLVIDVRDAAAFGRAHLPGATNLPVDEIEARLAELFMLPGQPVLYDRAGEVTKGLAEAMTTQGTEMAFLEGGILAWEAEGLPVERP